MNIDELARQLEEVRERAGRLAKQMSAPGSGKAIDRRPGVEARVGVGWSAAFGVVVGAMIAGATASELRDVA